MSVASASVAATSAASADSSNALAVAPAAPSALAAPTFRDLEPLPVSDPLGDEIALLCAHINAATFKLLRLLARYDEEGRWGGGFRSCAHWLSWRTGISIGPAREKVRVARCLPSLPLISEALASGELSYSKVRALTRVATPDNEAELLSFAHHGTTSHVERLVRLWRRVDRNADSQAARTARRGLSVWLTDDGSYAVRGRLTPEVGALLQKALEAAEDRLFRAEHEAGVEDRTSPRQRLRRRAGAVAGGAGAAAGAAGGARVCGGRRTRGRRMRGLTLPVRAMRRRSRSRREERPPLWSRRTGRAFQLKRLRGSPAMRRWCPSPGERTARYSMSDAGGGPSDGGSARPSRARDGGCRFPGCDSRMRTHAHHITPWAAGGETAMNNLVLLCPFHHRAVHEGGWRVKMDEWGVPRFFNPLGAPMPEVPGVGRVAAGGLRRVDSCRRRTTGWPAGMRGGRSGSGRGARCGKGNGSTGPGRCRTSGAAGRSTDAVMSALQFVMSALHIPTPAPSAR